MQQSLLLLTGNVFQQVGLEETKLNECQCWREGACPNDAVHGPGLHPSASGMQGLRENRHTASFPLFPCRHQLCGSADPNFPATGSDCHLAESILLPKVWEVTRYLKICIAIPFLWCKSSTVLQ